MWAPKTSCIFPRDPTAYTSEKKQKTKAADIYLAKLCSLKNEQEENDQEPEHLLPKKQTNINNNMKVAI